MKNSSPSDGPARFSGQLRHYHRSGIHKQKTWDEWVDGSPTKTAPQRSYAKAIGVFLAVALLSVIIAGLVIELR